MKRRRRTEILIQGDRRLAKELADSIAKAYDCREISPPQQAMAMIKMRESAKNSLFYIGEVLITEVKVEIEGRIGIGIVAGIEEQLASQLAVIDAAYKAELPEIGGWNAKLEEEERNISRERACQQAELFETKVSFETMET